MSRLNSEFFQHPKCRDSKVSYLVFISRQFIFSPFIEVRHLHSPKYNRELYLNFNQPSEKWIFIQSGGSSKENREFPRR